MPTLIKFVAAGAFALAASALCAAPAVAAEPVKAAKAARAKTTKKAKPAKDVHPKAADVVDPSDPEYPEPDVTDKATTDYNCELGNKVTIYQNEGDASHLALRWKKRLHRLTSVGTTTGAKRFENKLFGLIWIGIPSKGMLLDSKLNRQLANECKNAEQSQPKLLIVPAVQPAPQINEQLYPQPAQAPGQQPSQQPIIPPTTQQAVPGKPAA